MNDIEKVIGTLKILFRTADEKTVEGFILKRDIPRAISALEKQTPKKVSYEVEDEQEKSGYQETCPNCHCFVFDDYCARCCKSVR